MVCQRASMLLREDSVPRLVGSLASSAWYVLRRNPLFLPKRSIVPESYCSKYSMLHCTHNAERKFAVNRSMASCLTVLPLKNSVVIEVVTTFSSFQVP